MLKDGSPTVQCGHARRSKRRSTSRPAGPAAATLSGEDPLSLTRHPRLAPAAPEPPSDGTTRTGPRAVLRAWVETLPETARPSAPSPRLPTARSVPSPASRAGHRRHAGRGSSFRSFGFRCGYARAPPGAPPSFPVSADPARGPRRARAALGLPDPPTGSGGSRKPAPGGFSAPNRRASFRRELASPLRGPRAVVADDDPRRGPRRRRPHDQHRTRGPRTTPSETLPVTSRFNHPAPRLPKTTRSASSFSARAVISSAGLPALRCSPATSAPSTLAYQACLRRTLAGLPPPGGSTRPTPGPGRPVAARPSRRGPRAGAPRSPWRGRPPPGRLASSLRFRRWRAGSSRK